MVLDTLRQSMGGTDQLNPMQIARHTLFTAREKLDLLNQLKVVAMADGLTAPFDAEDIDEAIAHVRDRAARGVGTETVLRGDF